MTPEFDRALLAYEDAKIADQSRTRKALRTMARQDPAGFRAWVNSFSPSDEERLEPIYEALGSHMDDFSGWLLEEGKRLIGLAEEARHPKKILGIIDYFSSYFAYESDAVDFIQIVLPMLDHADPVFRFYGLDTLMTLLMEEGQEHPEAVAKVREVLLHDRDQIIRYWAQEVLADSKLLKDEEKLPEESGRAIADNKYIYQ